MDAQSLRRLRTLALQLAGETGDKTLERLVELAIQGDYASRRALRVAATIAHYADGRPFHQLVHYENVDEPLPEHRTGRARAWRWVWGYLAGQVTSAKMTSSGWTFADGALWLECWFQRGRRHEPGGRRSYARGIPAFVGVSSLAM